MSSKRFPGKVLHKVAGRPLLLYLWERLNRVRILEEVVVATSSEDSDDAIADFCGRNGVRCIRGDLLDIAGRFIEVLNICPCVGFARVCGDSPLLDWRLIEKAVGVFLNGDFDIVTNVLLRTYPKGQSVEVVRSKTFRRAYSQMRKNEDLEHVTRYFYNNRDSFRIFNFERTADCGAIQLSVDTSQDMDNFSSIIRKMNRPHWEYTLDEILELFKGVTT